MGATAAGRGAALAGALVALSAALGVLGGRLDTFPGDGWLAARARALGDPFAPVAAFFNEGSWLIAAALLLLAAGAALRRGRRDLLLFVVLAAAARPLLTVLREWVGRPRPSADFAARAMADGPSFPSGHTMTAVIAFGVWFVLAQALLPAPWARVVRGACVVAVALAGLARVWAGVHWPSDVYGGLVWGAAALAVARGLTRAR